MNRSTQLINLSEMAYTVGSKIKFRTVSEGDVLTGTIKSIAGTELTVDTEDGKTLTITYDNVVDVVS